MHFFGKLGLTGALTGGGILGYLLIRKILGHDILDESGPALAAGGVLLVTGVLLLSTGLLGELIMRTYFESQDRRIYAVREIVGRKQKDVAGGTR